MKRLIKKSFSNSFNNSRELVVKTSKYPAGVIVVFQNIGDKKLFILGESIDRFQSLNLDLEKHPLYIETSNTFSNKDVVDLSKKYVTLVKNSVDSSQINFKTMSKRLERLIFSAPSSSNV